MLLDFKVTIAMNSQQQNDHFKGNFRANLRYSEILERHNLLLSLNHLSFSMENLDGPQ